MATITSTTSGDLATGATWVGGIAPVEGDKVIIAHTGTAIDTFSTDATGYAIGATAITLTGAVVAGSYVIGETVRFGTDINNYTITNWVSGTKVLTVTALIVAIPASATLVTNYGHVITVAGTRIIGDDTATAVSVQGVLRASRVANSSLTIKGNLTSTTTSWKNTVWLDYGTETDPIPSGVTADFIYNYSAAMAQAKYTVNWQWGWRFTAWGATKTPWSRMSGAITAGATSLVVDDATGWAIGDLICISDTGNGLAYEADIKTVTNVAGTTISFTATTFAHKDRCVVGNFTRNVRFKPYSTSFGTEFRVNLTSLGTSSTGTEGRYELGYCAFEDMGYQGGTLPGLRFDVRDEQLVTQPILRVMKGLSSYVTNMSNTIGNGNVQVVNTAGTINPYPIQFCVLLPSNNTQSTGLQGLKIDNASADISDTWIFSGTGSGISFGPNVPYSSWTRGGMASGGGSPWFTASSAIQFTDTDFGAGLKMQFNGSYDTKFTNCRFGTGAGNGKLNNDSQWLVHGGSGFVNDWTFTDCYFNNTSYTENQLSTTPWSMVLSDATMRFIRPNGEDRAEYKRKNGTMYSENSVINRSNRSIKFAQSSNYGADGLYYNYPIPVTASTPVTVIGYLRKNSGYGASNLPTATLSGQGGTTATFTMTNSVDTWEKYTLTMTPTTTGNATLKITGKSNNGAVGTPVLFYSDGVVLANFNTYSRHYGYKFDFNPYVTVDPIITQTNEATVGAYTGIAIGTDITITGTITKAQLYDYCKWYLCQSANIGVTNFFTSTDGINFACTKNIVINGGALTGSGNITTTGTITTPSGGTSTVIISGSNGSTGTLNITGLSGHSVYIADNSLAQLDYQASVTGTYTKFIPPATTGSWTYVVKKAGYTAQKNTITASTGGLFSITASTPQKLATDGSAMYTASTSALCTVTFTGTTQANIAIGDGSVSTQTAFDETEVALATNNGMIWLASGKGECSIFLGFGGNFFFMTTGWRFLRALAGDANASVTAYAISTEGIVVDDVNGGVQFLSSTTVADIWNSGKALTLAKFLALQNP